MKKIFFLSTVILNLLFINCSPEKLLKEKPEETPVAICCGEVGQIPDEPDDEEDD